VSELAEPKKNSREDIKKKLDAKRQSNKRAYLDLIRMGADLDLTALVMMRLDTLLELIITEEQREMYELLFEQRLSRVIEQAKTDLTKETITQPIKRSGLIIP
jgi:hypothetical protein